MTTHYEVLGVSAQAEQPEIRRAYHRAARQWHPDRFVSAEPAESERAETEMRRVNEAWTELREPNRRRAYDRRLVGGGEIGGREGIRVDDGVTRIDPRLLDPSFLAARRHAQFEEISNRTSLVLRAAPLLALLGLLAAIFVFTAYARTDTSAAVRTTFPGPSIGAGIHANDCVSVLTGPSLLVRPCDGTADGRVIGARMPDGTCPLATIREVELSNGAIACLGAVD